MPGERNADLEQGLGEALEGLSLALPRGARLDSSAALQVRAVAGQREARLLEAASDGGAHRPFRQSDGDDAGRGARVAGANLEACLARTRPQPTRQLRDLRVTPG